MREKLHYIRDMWADAHPFGSGFGWQFYPEPPPSHYRRIVRSFLWLRRIALRFAAAKALITEPVGGGEDMPGRRYRAKALLLIWLPVRWTYPDYPSPASDVVGWDATTYNGGEMTCWEASFVAVRPGLMPGLAHIYREGGP